MGIIIWLGYIVLGIILVFLLYFIEKKYHLNKFQSICFSIIYMMILAGLGARFGFSRFNENIFFDVPENMVLCINENSSKLKFFHKY